MQLCVKQSPTWVSPVNNILSTIVAVIAAVLSTIGLIQMVGLNPITLIGGILFAVCVGALTYVSLLAFLTKMDKIEAKQEVARLTHEEFTGLEGLSGINESDFKELVLGARAKLLAINDASKRLVDSNMRFKVLTLVGVGHAIVEEVKRDPKDYRIARSWFNTHLDQTLNIVNKFADVDSKSSTIRTKLADDFETTISQLNTNFNNLLEDLRANDVNALKIDMEVLNDQLKLENR